MDAHALLTSQGWRGFGHSLHPTSDRNGLSRPLLVSKKQNNHGVGNKLHKTSDMWWMDAFDQSLKGLDTAQEGKVVQTLKSSALDKVAKPESKFVGNGGLYAFFVKGESLSGTITRKETVKSLAIEQRSQSENGGESKGRRKARKIATRNARACDLLNTKDPVSIPSGEPVQIEGDEKEAVIEGLETKAQRRERRKQKKLTNRAVEQSLQDPKSTAKRKKRRKP